MAWTPVAGGTPNWTPPPAPPAYFDATVAAGNDAFIYTFDDAGAIVLSVVDAPDAWIEADHASAGPWMRAA